jgi:WD40 repeat protein
MFKILKVKLFLASTGFALSQAIQSGTRLTDIAWSPSGEWLATASTDSNVKLWNTNGSHSRTLEHLGPAYSLAWSPDGRRLTAATSDFRFRVYDVHHGLLCNIVWPHPLTSIALTDHELVSAIGSSVEVWNLDELIRRPTLQKCMYLNGHLMNVRCVKS